jgi:ABC-type phosphate/phosphonate transport system ATPase subunit
MIFPQFKLIGRLDVLTNVLMDRRKRSSGPTSILVWSAADKIITLSALEQ